MVFVGRSTCRSRRWGLALQLLLEKNPTDLWIADLLVNQFIMWNRWWADTRQYSPTAGVKNSSTGGGLLAPGSTRANNKIAISCTDQDPVTASRCETGLDNSPLYDGATFIPAENVIDSIDVGMTALYARDCTALARICRSLGDPQRLAFAAELEARVGGLVAVLNKEVWNEEAGIYVNKLWRTNAWYPVDKTTKAYVVGPPNLYPMLAGAPSDAQVNRMISRYIANASEFAVTAGQAYGLPSISRSSSAFGDNSYWRGRSWGPMNMLVYLGLKEYAHLSSVKVRGDEETSTFPTLEV